MPPLTEPAPAKINLTLRVLGRRPDGYHALESLVAFASIGDRLTLSPGPLPSLDLSGPFAAGLETEGNLVLRAVAHAAAVAPGLVSGRIGLEKNLPVASGIGGGSADAAATLRLLARLNPDRAPLLDWHAIALGLGADVPVCLVGRPALMCGVGERVSPLPALPEIGIVLANPRLPVATADVFRALAASPLPADVPPEPLPPPAFADAAACARYLAAGTNDLEGPARRLCPAIGDVLAALDALPGVLLARMSGSGATCYALFPTATAARAAAARLAEPHGSRWWIAAGHLL